MPANDLTGLVAARAASPEAAASAFTIQLWTLYGVGVLTTTLRTYARINAVGVKGLQFDDFAIWLAILFYTVQTVLGFSVGNLAHGLANNSLTDAQRLSLSPESAEYQQRVIGSKIQLAGWGSYSLLMCFLKLCVLGFYIRLTEGLGRRYRIQIRVGFVLVIGTFVASTFAIFLTCIPFDHNWQINPNPGNHCQPAIASAVVWTCYAANITTDIYLILIPLPMLCSSSLKLSKKLASSLVLGAGIFILVCATLKTAFVVAYPIDGAQLAGEWGTREAFVAVITTNLPMIFPLIKTWSSPFFSYILGTTQKSSTPHSVIHTIGSGGGKRNQLNYPFSALDLSTTSSRERIVQQVPLQSFIVSGEPPALCDGPNSVYISQQVDVVEENIGGRVLGQKNW
ncbi:hypothetical protein F5Y14DRAFT_465674 [Nemania sp. NC0429]|nr:hypothetical protein F5Y14DRAFT_465674 [Nemania sp. NC0429]